MKHLYTSITFFQLIFITNIFLIKDVFDEKNQTRVISGLTYYNVESYCVAITRRELAHSSRTKRSDAPDGFKKLDLNSATILASGTGMGIKLTSFKRLFITSSFLYISTTV